ncbi:unnamed protein product [Leptosia nina]|uniref:Uncharacterized protein n=1 Tax=Leptosia nina TaxID=320188 RepID=A0AAV1JX21_9NEOP
MVGRWGGGARRGERGRCACALTRESVAAVARRPWLLVPAPRCFCCDVLPAWSILIRSPCSRWARRRRRSLCPLCPNYSTHTCRTTTAGASTTSGGSTSSSTVSGALAIPGSDQML